jgi:hypothetical protein
MLTKGLGSLLASSLKTASQASTVSPGKVCGSSDRDGIDESITMSKAGSMARIAIARGMSRRARTKENPDGDEVRPGPVIRRSLSGILRLSVFRAGLTGYIRARADGLDAPCGSVLISDRQPR